MKKAAGILGILFMICSGQVWGKIVVCESKSSKENVVATVVDKKTAYVNINDNKTGKSQHCALQVKSFRDLREGVAQYIQFYFALEGKCAEGISQKPSLKIPFVVNKAQAGQLSLYHHEKPLECKILELNLPAKK